MAACEPREDFMARIMCTKGLEKHRLTAEHKRAKRGNARRRKRMQRLTFPFPFVHHQSHVYQQPRPSGTTINRRNEDTWPVTADNKEIAVAER